MTQRAVLISEEGNCTILVGSLELDMVRQRMRYTPPSPHELAEWQRNGWRLEWRDNGETVSSKER